MNDMTLAFFPFFLFWDKLQYHILAQELLHLHRFLAWPSYPWGFKELCNIAWAAQPSLGLISRHFKKIISCIKSSCTWFRFINEIFEKLQLNTYTRSYNRKYRHKTTFSNSSINKVAMVKNAFLIMSL